MSKPVISTFAFATIFALAACGAHETPPPPYQPPSTQPPATPAAAPPAPAPPIAAATTGVRIDQTIASACNVAPPKAFFEFDSSTLKPKGQDTLDGVAACLTNGPLKGRAIRVVGHADPRGTEQYNQTLGKSRADTVSDYLVTKGVEQGKMNVLSRGEDNTNPDNEHGWTADRRVDIRLAQLGRMFPAPRRLRITRARLRWRVRLAVSAPKTPVCARGAGR